MGALPRSTFRKYALYFEEMELKSGTSGIIMKVLWESVGMMLVFSVGANESGDSNVVIKAESMDFQGKVVVVTGASSGIGWAMALEFARRGARLGLIARREAQLQELSALLRAQGTQAVFSICDVRDRQAVLAAFAELEQQLGSVDILIANAGVGTTNTIAHLNVTGTESVIRVNLLGVIYSIEAVLPKMLARREGQIVAISSLASYKGLPSAAAYCASKSAINAYMESLRIQMRGTGVSFTTVCPGFIRTPMIEKNKGMFLIMSAERAARIIARAVKRKKKVCNFPWLTTRLMKLTTWLPDWLLSRFMPEQVGGQGADETG